MVVDRRTLTVFIEPGKQGDVIRRKYWAKGLPCPMAISVGQAPILGMMAGTAFRPGRIRICRRPARASAGRSTWCAAKSRGCRSRPMPSSCSKASCRRPRGKPARRSVRRMARLLHGRWAAAGSASRGHLSSPRRDHHRPAADQAELCRPAGQDREPGGALGCARGGGRAGGARGVEPARRRLSLHAGDLDQATACRARQDGGPGRGRLRRPPT